MPSFAHILLEVLVQKSHDLIREEVCLCLYAMAAVDFSLFHGETLPSFLSKRSQLREEQRSALATGYKMDEVGISLGVTYAVMGLLAYIHVHVLCLYSNVVPLGCAITDTDVLLSLYLYTPLALALQDLPSFVQNIHQFASDLRYFHLLNSALPQGSVKLVT